MKSLHCDQVFEILTRGPFPTGSAIDAPVERHLSACHECRQLAEALRPAIELFHEAIEPEESRDLPGYHGSLEPSSGGLAQMVADAIASESPARSATCVEAPTKRLWEKVFAHRPSQFEAFALAMAVGGLLVLSMAGFGGIDSPSTAEAASVVPNPVVLTELASKTLGPECLAWSPGASIASLKCCTECHVSGGGRRLESGALAIVTANCRACHP